MHHPDAVKLSGAAAAPAPRAAPSADSTAATDAATPTTQGETRTRGPDASKPNPPDPSAAATTDGEDAESTCKTNTTTTTTTNATSASVTKDKHKVQPSGTAATTAEITLQAQERQGASSAHKTKQTTTDSDRRPAAAAAGTRRARHQRPARRGSAKKAARRQRQRRKAEAAAVMAMATRASALAIPATVCVPPRAAARGQPPPTDQDKGDSRDDGKDSAGDGHSLSIVVDTGAACGTLLSGPMARALGWTPPSSAREGGASKVQVANGATITALSGPRVKLVFGPDAAGHGLSVSPPTQVVEDLPFAIVLGMDTLRELDAEVRVGREGASVRLGAAAARVRLPATPPTRSTDNCLLTIATSLDATLAKAVAEAKVAEATRHELASLLARYEDVFAPPDAEPAKVDPIRLHVKPGSEPVRGHPIPLSAADADFARAKIKEMLEAGQIAVAEPGPGTYSSPAFVVNGNRLVVNLVAFNRQLEAEGHPTATAEDILRSLAGAKFFTVLDLKAGFMQCPLDEASQRYTGFTVAGFHGKFRRLAMGLKTAPAHFSRIMSRALDELRPLGVYWYMDDILIATESEDEMVTALAAVLAKLEELNLKASPSKLQLGQREVAILGFHASASGIAPIPDKVDTILSTPQPRSAKQLQSFLGQFDVYHRFVPDAAGIAKPLRAPAASKARRLAWTDEMSAAYAACKDALKGLTQLAHPTAGKPFIIIADASARGVGAVLLQEHVWPNGATSLRPIRFTSKSFAPHQAKWDTMARELYACNVACARFHHLFKGSPVTIFSDNRNLAATAAHTPRGQWLLHKLQLYGVSIAHCSQEFIRMADYLSRLPAKTSPDAAAIEAAAGEFNPQRVYSDLDKNSAPRDDDKMEQPADAAEAEDEEPPPTPVVLAVAGPATDQADAANEPPAAQPSAEATKLIAVTTKQLREAHSLSMRELALEQRRDDLCRRLLVRVALEASDSVAVSHQDRAMAKAVPPLFARGHLTVRPDGVLVYSPPDTDEVGNAARRVVVPLAKRAEILLAMHQHNHLGGKRLLAMVRRGYVWPGMRQDAIEFARACEFCQRAKAARDPAAGLAAPLDLHPDQDLRPWGRVHIDFTGSIEIRGKPPQFLLVAVDSFTGFTVVTVLPSKDSVAAAEAFEQQVLLRFGAPRVLVTDNGTEFQGQAWQQLTNTYGFLRATTSAYRPASNGRVERANRWIKNCLGAILEAETADPLKRNDVSWQTRVDRLALAYNSSADGDPAYTPYYLMHGRHPYLPGDLAWLDGVEADLLHDGTRLPSDRTGRDDTASYHRARTSDLAIAYASVRDKRLEAAATMARRLNLSRHFVQFKVGDMVLCYNPGRNTRDNPLAPAFEGPYKIVDMSSSGLAATLARQPHGRYTRGRPTKRKLVMHVSFLSKFHQHSRSHTQDTP